MITILLVALYYIRAKVTTVSQRKIFHSDSIATSISMKVVGELVVGELANNESSKNIISRSYISPSPYPYSPMLILPCN